MNIILTYLENNSLIKQEYWKNVRSTDDIIRLINTKTFNIIISNLPANKKLLFRAIEKLMIKEDKFKFRLSFINSCFMNTIIRARISMPYKKLTIILLSR